MSKTGKKVVVFFNISESMGPPLDTKMYYEAHKELAELIEEKGGDYHFVRGIDSHLGGGRFSKSWKFSDDGIVETGEVQADIIYDKGSSKVKLNPGVEMINPRFINDICENKSKTYELFPNFSPKSLVINSSSELEQAIDTIGSEKVVIKPVVGYGGAGIEILTREEARNYKIGSGPTIIQQFIDTSQGIEGLVDGVHDLRLVIMAGEVVNSMIRTPPTGSLIANLKLGGSLEVIDTKDLPSSALAFAREIDEIFEKYPKRVYSVDMAYEGEQPYLVELNSRPGLWNRARGKAAIDFQEKLTDLLLSN